MDAGSEHRPALPLEFDGTGRVDPVGTEQYEDGVPLRRERKNPPFSSMQATPGSGKPQIDEQDRVLRPRTDLEGADLGGRLVGDLEGAGPLASALNRGVTFPPAATLPDLVAGDTFARPGKTRMNVEF